MQQTLVPVLLLAAVTLSTSNVLPMMSDRPNPIATNGQHNDNILSNRYSRAVHNNIFYTVPVGTSKSSLLMRKLAEYLNVNDHQSDESLNGVIDKEDNYDVEGFRKKQWHNYPRQLDRLHEYLTHYHSGDRKRNLNTDNLEYYDSKETEDRNIGDISTNEYLLDSNEGKNVYNSVDALSPLLILKVQLACLNNRLKYVQSRKTMPFQVLNIDNETNDPDDKIFTKEIIPSMKVKREGSISQEFEISDEKATGERKTKRLFSLWSRLQSLSHKGHELPHRRHLGTFYGFPDGDGGGKLTAETRATMIRPPGSPLRWG